MVDAYIAPRIQPPIGFAHRGARAHAPENTLEAFTLAVRLGATGLESDAWLTADDQVVLDHDGVVRQRLRRRPIRDLRRDELPEHMPTLAELYEEVGTHLPLSLDVKDPDAAGPIIEVARRAGPDAEANLWLCHHHWEVAASWRQLSPTARLVDSTRIHRIDEGPERRAARLASVGIDALNLHWTDWTGGYVTMLHRFGLFALGWDAQHARALEELLRMGIDGLYSDHVDRMVEAIATAPRIRG